jgi:pimeloyl-ACP methyl ester carboxylesterase
VKSGGQRFPLSSLAQYPAQLVPNIEVTLVGGATNKINDLAPLLDKIGAAIVIVHSQSGVMGLGAVIKRPKLIKGLISVEGGCEPVADADLPTYAKVPPNGGARRLGCQSTVAKFKNAGGKSPSQAKQLVVDIDARTVAARPGWAGSARFSRRLCERANTLSAEWVAGCYLGAVIHMQGYRFHPAQKFFPT